MEFFKYGGIALAALCGLVLLILAFKSGKPLRILLLNAFLGISVLILIPYNPFYRGAYTDKSVDGRLIGRFRNSRGRSVCDAAVNIQCLNFA